ncbi:MAG TPA: hypothetical protein PK360_16635 [bacterium]|nr:hypothetical protein [bacterium]
MNPHAVIPIHTAILSVFDKTGIAAFAKVLFEHHVLILSTGGTGKALAEAGISYQEVSAYTGSPEMLHGRVKTLHPRIHGGLLFKREDPVQAAEAEKYGIRPIDLVAVNLYPFEATIAKPGVTLDEATENIDIGGPAMIRAAAKNFPSVAVITDPADYGMALTEIRESGGITFATRHRLAAKAFQHTSRYDQAIAAYLAGAIQ